MNLSIQFWALIFISIFYLSCSKEEETVTKLPQIQMNQIYITSSSTAIITSQLISSGNDNVLDQGICWGNFQNPTVKEGFYLSSQSIDTVFQIMITNLKKNTVYYVRSYIRNSVGISYSNQKSFTTWDVTDPIKDAEGNIYPTIRIGNQIWMQENLKSTIYSDGTPIPNTASKSFKSKNYGLLYTWEAAIKNSTTEKPQGACPTGWHIPNNLDWITLESTLAQPLRNGDMMKAYGNEHWLTENLTADNSSGFSAIPAGMYDGTQLIESGMKTYFWSSSSYSKTYAWIRSLSAEEAILKTQSDGDKTKGFSIRCIKN